MSAGILAAASPPGFSFLSYPRLNKRGGGIAIIYKNDLKISMIPLQSTYNAFEVAALRLSLSSCSIVLLIIYRPPSAALSGFESQFSSLCAEFIGDELIALGDFNLPSNSPDDLPPPLDCIAAIFDLIDHVRVPTHARGNILDRILTRSSSSFLCDVTVGDYVSDHRAVLFSIKGHSSSKSIMKATSSRALRRLDDNMFSDAIHSILAPSVAQAVLSPSAAGSSSSKCSSLVDLYNLHLRCILDCLAPLKTRKIRGKISLPWWSPTLVTARKSLRFHERVWRHSKLEVHRLIFIQERRSYHCLLKSVKRQFLYNSLTELAGDSKKTWNLLNKSLGRTLMPSLPEHDNPTQLAAKFNEYFLSKVATIYESFNASSDGDVPPIDPPSPLSEITLLSDFHLAPEKEVHDIIISSPSKSSSCDPIPTWLLRRHLSCLIAPITSIVNSSLDDGMPQSFKIATIIPSLKKKSLDVNVLGNYRPIANLPFLSKVIERVVSSRLRHHLKSNNLIDEFQSAYCSNHSCESALVKLKNDVLTAMNDSKITILVLLDLSCAFDTVNHHILLARLESLGVTGNALKWFKSYLASRLQYVKIADHSSPLLSVSQGVPQGSVLGPILFTAYLIGIGAVISRHRQISYLLYADDIQLFTNSTPQSIPLALKSLENCVADIREWLSSKFLLLNTTKTELILFGSPTQLHKTLSHDICIRVGDDIIRPQNSVRNLGVFFDPTLSMELHVQKICRDSFSHCRLISFVRDCLTKESCIMAINSLVLSRIDFAPSLLIGVSQKLLHRLQLVINTAARIILKIRKFDHISKGLDLLQWLPIEKRIQLRIALLSWKAVRLGEPTYLASLLSAQPSCQYGLRSVDQDLLMVPWIGSAKGSRAFRIVAPRIWNSIPIAVRNSSKACTFVEQCKQLLLSSSFL